MDAAWHFDGVWLGHDEGVRSPVAVIVAFSLLAAACSGGDSSDVDAYCELVRDGVGVVDQDSAVEAAEFEELLAVAPPEIGGAVLELSNATRNLGEIEEIDQLFAAAFDPDAQAARLAFARYSEETCGVSDQEAPTGLLGNTSDLIATVQAYVDDSFASIGWVAKVRYDPEFDDGELVSLTATFVVAASDDEAAQVCAALSVFLYELRDDTGTLSVVDDSLVVFERQGPDAQCEPVQIP